MEIASDWPSNEGIDSLGDSTAKIALQGHDLVFELSADADGRPFAALDSLLFVRTTGTEVQKGRELADRHDHSQPGGVGANHSYPSTPISGEGGALARNGDRITWVRLLFVVHGRAGCPHSFRVRLVGRDGPRLSVD